MTLCNVFSPASLVAQTVKNLPAKRETWVWSLCWEDPLEEGMHPTPVFLPGEFHRQRSLAGYSPWGQRVGCDWGQHKIQKALEKCFHKQGAKLLWLGICVPRRNNRDQLTLLAKQPEIIYVNSFLRHRTSGNEGQWSLRYKNQRRWDLWLP